MNLLSSRLAARTGTRQLDALAKSDAAADAVDTSIVLVWRRLMRLLQDAADQQAAARVFVPPPGFKFAVARLLAELRDDAHASLSRHFNALARWGYDSSARTMADTLPASYVKAALIRRHLGESRALTEADPPIAADVEQLFPPPSLQQVLQILHVPIHGSTWTQALDKATQLADPARWAHAVASGFAAGQTPRQIAQALQPVVQGVQSSARRIARTYGMQIAHRGQMEAHAQVDDLIIGYQVHALLDQHTRPEHAHRNGTIYYKTPGAGQLGLDQCPHPPLEADGSMAWNCRCWLSPVMTPLQRLMDAPAFAAPETPLVPDHAVYSQWFATADESRRRLAVGTRRLRLMNQLAGDEGPSWEHFVDPETGGLLSTAELHAESDVARAERIAKARAVIAHRGRQLAQVATFGFLPTPTPEPAPVPIAVSPSVSVQFFQTVSSAVEAIPSKIQTLLDDQGFRVVVPASPTQDYPHLAGIQPPGYPVGTTYEHAAGFRNGADIVVPETRRDITTGQYVPNAHAAAVLRHESGHALNAALGDFSDKPAFVAAYQADLAYQQAQQVAMDPYFHQADYLGRRETFAEVFACLHGTGTTRVPNFLAAWPNAAKLIQQRIKSIPVH
ncbi:MAG: phage head morphogenesis protein [Gemmataceae bacterium]|nr:phage head morphogenesis protein [Gemmataceae bacterium]